MDDDNANVGGPDDLPITLADIEKMMAEAENYNAKSALFEQLTQDQDVRDLLACAMLAFRQSCINQAQQIDQIAASQGCTPADVILAVLQRDAATFHKYPYRAGLAYLADNDGRG